MIGKNVFEHHKGYLRPFLVVLALALTAFLIAKTVNEINLSKEIINIPTITITGEGKVFARPDIGRIDVSAVTEGETASEAQDKNTEIMNKTIEFLKSEGVEEKDIKTANYSISPRYDYIKGRREFKGYEVSQTLEVKIRNLDKVGDILSGATEKGVNLLGGLSFAVDNEESLKEEARAKAIQNAKEKADGLAKELGVKLGRVISFGEYGYSPMPVFFEKTEALGMGGGIPEIPAGENEITANVSITYEIK